MEVLNEYYVAVRIHTKEEYNKANNTTRPRVRYGLSVSGGHRGNKGH